MSEPSISFRLEALDGRGLLGQRRHDLRIGKQPAYVDAKRAGENAALFRAEGWGRVEDESEEQDGARIHQLMDASRTEIEGRAKRKTSVGKYWRRAIITFSHEAQKALANEGKLPHAEALTAFKAFADAHGVKLLTVDFHGDETAPHYHANFEGVNDKGYALRLNREELSATQDQIASHFANYGLTRGKRKEERKAAGEDPSKWNHRTVRELHEQHLSDNNAVLTFQQEQIASYNRELNELEQQIAAERERLAKNEERAEKARQKAETDEAKADKSLKNAETYERRARDAAQSLEQLEARKTELEAELSQGERRLAELERVTSKAIADRYDAERALGSQRRILRGVEAETLEAIEKRDQVKQETQALEARLEVLEALRPAVEALEAHEAAVEAQRAEAGKIGPQDAQKALEWLSAPLHEIISFDGTGTRTPENASTEFHRRLSAGMAANRQSGVDLEQFTPQRPPAPLAEAGALAALMRPEFWQLTITERNGKPSIIAEAPPTLEEQVAEIKNPYARRNGLAIWRDIASQISLALSGIARELRAMGRAVVATPEPPPAAKPLLDLPPKTQEAVREALKPKSPTSGPGL